jgi:hypothetical protein
VIKGGSEFGKTFSFCQQRLTNLRLATLSLRRAGGLPLAKTRVFAKDTINPRMTLPSSAGPPLLQRWTSGRGFNRRLFGHVEATRNPPARVTPL